MDDDYGAELVDFSKNNKTPEQDQSKNKGKKASPKKESGNAQDKNDKDDYGLELQAEAKPFEPKGAQELYKKHPKNVQPEEEEDEDDMYQKARIIGGGKAKAQINSTKKADKPAYLPKDTLIVFTQNEFLYLDYNQDTWAIGDISAAGGAPLEIAENCSVVRVDDRCKHSCVFVTGGVASQGSILNWVYGLQFYKDGNKGIVGVMSWSDPQMLLPEQRMMHQSCMVQDANGDPMLLVAGGKVGSLPGNSQYTNSVVGFSMKEVLNGQPATKGWTTLQPMNSARANFAMTVIDNQVYALGGIQGKATGDQSHAPILAAQFAEKYDPKTNQWEKVEIEGAMPLACFGWTPLQSRDQILIVGGTDGEMLQENCWLIDLKAKKATIQTNSIESQLAMNKLVYRQKQNTVYSIGGYGSGGVNYQKKMGDKDQWQEFSRSHVSLNLRDENEIELANSCGIYFN